MQREKSVAIINFVIALVGAVKLLGEAFGYSIDLPSLVSGGTAVAIGVQGFLPRIQKKKPGY